MSRTPGQRRARAIGIHHATSIKGEATMRHKEVADAFDLLLGVVTKYPIS